MEWVETTARTVEEALDQALDKLGVDEDEVEYEVLEEPKAGLFGRVRGQARLRARVEPKAPRSKGERNERRRRPKGGGDKAKPAGRSDSSGSGTKGNEGGESGGAAKKSSGRSGGGGRDSGERRPRDNNKRDNVSDLPDLDEATVTSTVEGFVSGLAAAFGADPGVTSEVEDGTLQVGVNEKVGLMVGPKGRTLDAVQELARTVVQRAGNTELRVRVDVGGYRQMRRDALEAYAASAVERFADTGEEVRLESMPSADRKIVHDALSEAEGISTYSEGREPRRRIVIGPAE